MGNGIIRYLVECILNVLFPQNENCLICNAYLDNDEVLCKQCENKIQYCEDKFNLKKHNIDIECYSAAYYASTISDMVKRLKYKSDFTAGEYLGKLLTNTLETYEIEFDLITFVPMSKNNYKKRGFNQSKLLANYVSKRTNKVTKELLIKQVETMDQIGLDGANRWMNLEKCFSAINPTLIKNKKIILIDDVITTGATAFHCAEQLLQYEAEKVTILTVAKSRL